ncbi:MAG: tetratricopeptide repeat protein [Nocardiopsaceae bacterium]|nr:tetratricopeptide repeat protein [Nocardiopsaceae bacterium]
MDPSVVWTAIGSVAGVAALVVTGWQVRIGIADHRLRQAAAQRDARATSTTMVVQRRPEESRQPVRLPPRPLVLAGREELLADLHARLADGPAPRTVALCGLGGAGKTSTAVEYAHRHLAEVSVCWQLRAEEPVALEADFAMLAAQLGARDPADVRDPVASVHAVLARQEADWLLIFDNAPDLASVERFLPPAGPGRILVTTQSQHWPPDQALEVPTLDAEAAVSFLVSRTGSTDRAAAADLADELGGLPLALAQAAAYMQATAMSMRAYLELFRARQADLLARGEAAGHPAHVAATLGLALSELGEQAPVALGLMRLLAFLAPEPVPLGPLLSDSGAAAARLTGGGVPTEIAPLAGDPVVCGDAVAALRRYSLVTPAGDGAVLVHRLVRAVTRAALTAADSRRWQEAAAALVDAAVPADTGTPATWPSCALLLPHAQAVLHLASTGMSRIATFLGESGNPAAARDLCRRVAAAREDSLGPEHPDTLTARVSLATWTGEETGNASEVRDQHAALLPIRERILGPEHPDTLSVREGLASWTGFMGDATAARDQHAALLPIFERVYGPEHPDTLFVCASLARWTGNAGHAATARDRLVALLPIWERVSGPEHPRTLFIRGLLARYTGGAGDAAAARDQFTALLPIDERVLGPEHRETLFARYSLSLWTGEVTGNATAARDQHAALLPIFERVFGPEHAGTLLVRGSLARWTGETGDAAAARDQYAALLPIDERVHGPEHPDALAVRSGLAHWTGAAGDATAARDQYAALLPIRERVSGPEHPDTLTDRANLAHWTRQAGGQAISAPPPVPRIQ